MEVEPASTLQADPISSSADGASTRSGRAQPYSRRIVAAAESGKYMSMASIARKVGVSRERVRQVLNATGYTSFGPRHSRPQWSCPECGETVKKTTKSRLRVHMPAFCRKCAKKYCRRGHLRSEHTTSGKCRLCERIQRRRIVEVRTCLECGKDHEISQAFREQIKRGASRGDFHLKCYFAYMRREGRPANRSSGRLAVRR